MKKDEFFSNTLSDEDKPDMYFEEYDEELSDKQKYAFKRWANAYNYRTYQGYLTARYGFQWKDYSFLREHSP